MMKSNPVLKKTILSVVDNQLRANNPPETKQTYENLLKRGYSKNEAKRLIGCVVAAETFDILKKEEPFNQERFAANLNRLPEIPGEEE